MDHVITGTPYFLHGLLTLLRHDFYPVYHTVHFQLLMFTLYLALQGSSDSLLSFFAMQTQLSGY